MKPLRRDRLRRPNLMDTFAPANQIGMPVGRIFYREVRAQGGFATIQSQDADIWIVTVYCGRAVPKGEPGHTSLADDWRRIAR